MVIKILTKVNSSFHSTGKILYIYMWTNDGNHVSLRSVNRVLYDFFSCIGNFFFFCVCVCVCRNFSYTYTLKWHFNLFNLFSIWHFSFISPGSKVYYFIWTCNRSWIKWNWEKKLILSLISWILHMNAFAMFSLIWTEKCIKDLDHIFNFVLIYIYIY